MAVGDMEVQWSDDQGEASCRCMHNADQGGGS